MRKISRPSPGEYAPQAEAYIQLVPHTDLVLECLLGSLATTRDLVAALSPEQLAYRYAPGKWTIKQIVAHLCDDERIYVYRALRFARGDSTPLPGFDQDLFAEMSNADERDIGDLLEELSRVRLASVSFFDGLADDALSRRGTADGSTMTVGAIAYHIAGHELRHLQVVRERYL